MALSKFTPRYFEEILQDMVNYVRLTTPELTDFNIGSRIRTILEACAMEDDEQYHQMVALLSMWNLANNRGSDLDERLTEYNVARMDSITASGTVIVTNTGLVTTHASSPATATVATTVSVYSSKGFPATGTLRIGEGLSTVEDVVYLSNATSTGVFTLVAAVTNDHAKNERVSLVSGAPISISPGLQVAVPATDMSPMRVASVKTSGSIAAGNYESGSLVATMDVAGVNGNVAVGAVSIFEGSPPFDGASVRNDTAFSGGRDEESDEQFLGRGRSRIQSLARCTPLALEQLVVGTEFITTANVTQRVITAKVREDFKPTAQQDRVLLYIWPGVFGFDTTAAISGAEVITASAEDGQKFFQLAHPAIVPGSLKLQRQIVGAGPYIDLVEGTDYFVNEATGWVQFVVNQGAGLNKTDAVRASTYKYYTGLVLEVQNVVNGLEYDPVVYPGISAAGVKVLVIAPNSQPLLKPVECNIQVIKGFTEASVSVLVEDALIQYVSELKIGENVILSEMIERAMRVDGMYNVQFSFPTSDIEVFDDAILNISSLDIIVS